LTGDTGFKGSWLALWLTRLGAEVHGYALPPERAEDNWSRCEVGALITHVDGDIRDAPRMLEAARAAEPEVVFHLAAQPLVLDSYARPAYTFDVNVVGTAHVLDVVRALPSVRAAVIVTTDKCYENQGFVWGYRETDPLGGHDPYSASKACAELVVAAYRRSFFGAPGAARVATARAGNVLGAGDWADNRIVPDAIRALSRGLPVPVRNPDAVRPWQHVLDPVAGYLQLGHALATSDDPTRFASAWNFGPSPLERVPVHELVDALIAAWGDGSRELTPQREAPHEAHILTLDSARARLELRWRPRLGFAELVRFTVDGYRAELGSAPSDCERVRASRIAQIDACLALASTPQVRP
jgi:CDP-glucose 4,6-dehydratase